MAERGGSELDAGGSERALQLFEVGGYGGRRERAQADALDLAPLAKAKDRLAVGFARVGVRDSRGEELEG